MQEILSHSVSLFQNIRHFPFPWNYIDWNEYNKICSTCHCTKNRLLLQMVVTWPFKVIVTMTMAIFSCFKLKYVNCCWFCQQMRNKKHQRWTWPIGDWHNFKAHIDWLHSSENASNYTFHNAQRPFVYISVVFFFPPLILIAMKSTENYCTENRTETGFGYAHTHITVEGQNTCWSEYRCFALVSKPQCDHCWSSHS